MNIKIERCKTSYLLSKIEIYTGSSSPICLRCLTKINNNQAKTIGYDKLENPALTESCSLIRSRWLTSIFRASVKSLHNVMLQICVNIFPSSVTPWFLSLDCKIISLYMPVHTFKVIFVYYKDNTVRSNLPHIDQCIFKLISRFHLSCGSCMNYSPTPP